MSARLSALVCLLSLGPCFGRSEPVGPTDPTLVVFLKSSAQQNPEVVQAMHKELKTLMATAGYSVEWRDSSSSRDAGSAELIVLDLRGACDSSASFVSRVAFEDKPALAQTAVVDGRVLPFSWVNCDTLSQMLAPSLAKEMPHQRAYLTGRSMARIVAHEIYHVLANEQQHSEAGLAKTCFSMSDLLGTRFEFAPSALAKMAKTGPASAPYIAEVSSGGSAQDISESVDATR